MARISSVEVLEEGSGELREVSAPSEKDLERKEVKAREAAEKAFRSINFSVSPAGQQMFDMLSKTYVLRLRWRWFREGCLLRFPRA
eukprot:scaffold407_cov251-Pinguiococcus_pyrenoidosus.AAC.37